MRQLDRLCFAVGVLNVDTRITWPRSLENGVTTAGLPWLAEERLTHLLGVIETYTSRYPAHYFQNFYDLCHELQLCH